MTPPVPLTCGLVLAGGRARRLGGGDKSLVKIGGSTILDRVLATLSGQCTGIVISANGDPARIADTGCEVVPDSVPDFAGPLAGILAGLDWLAAQGRGIEWMLSAPGDCPFLPDDLVERLHEARREMGAGVPLAIARSGNRQHHTTALWPLALRKDLRAALTVEGLHKVETFAARYDIALADWPAEPFDPFFNVNTPEDLAIAESIATERHL